MEAHRQIFRVNHGIFVLYKFRKLSHLGKKTSLFYSVNKLIKVNLSRFKLRIKHIGMYVLQDKFFIVPFI